MTSQVGICNIALVDLGSNNITSLTDNSPAASALSTVYDAVLEAELSDHPWQFAVARATIPASAAAPAFGWAGAYPLPADFLKLVMVGESWCFYNPESPGFTLEGNSVLTDAGSPLSVRYVRKVTNTGSYSALFVLALAKSLAAAVCERLTQSASKKEGLLQERENIIRRARRANDIQLPPQRAVPSSWELSLYGGAG